MELCNGCVNHVLISRALMQASVSKSMAYLHALTPFFTFHSSPLSGVSRLEHAYIIWPLAGMLAAGVHICRLTHLEGTYIIWPSAGMLAAGAHIFRLTRLECAY